MPKTTLLIIQLFIAVISVTAQESLPPVIVKRIQVADPDISKKESFFYKRKEEFHQVLVYDMGERTGKKAPVAFYVDFLAEREKVIGEFIVDIRWVNMVFYNPETQLRTKPTGNVSKYKSSEGISNTIEQVQNEYKYIYPVNAVLEINIYKKENDSLKIVHQSSEPITYQYETIPKNTNRTGYNDRPPKATSPDKPLIFRELNLTYYTHIKEIILNYFNGKV
jgi:hypothetical protein